MLLAVPCPSSLTVEYAVLLFQPLQECVCDLAGRHARQEIEERVRVRHARGRGLPQKGRKGRTAELRFQFAQEHRTLAVQDGGRLPWVDGTVEPVDRWQGPAARLLLVQDGRECLLSPDVAKGHHRRVLGDALIEPGVLLIGLVAEQYVAVDATRWGRGLSGKSRHGERDDEQGDHSRNPLSASGSVANTGRIVENPEMSNTSRTVS